MMTRCANTPTVRPKDCWTSSWGAFTQALYEQAQKEERTVVSMKNDCKTVFPPEAAAVTAIDILLEPTPPCSSMPQTTTPACSRCSRRVSPRM
jgi:hypothetical protein